MTILFLFLLLFLLMFIGVPIAASLGLAGSVTIMLFSPDSVRSLAIKLFETSEHYTLLAIPFFLLSGAFMTTGGVAKRLIDFANACVGHIRAAWQFPPYWPACCSPHCPAHRRPLSQLWVRLPSPAWCARVIRRLLAPVSCVTPVPWAS